MRKLLFANIACAALFAAGSAHAVSLQIVKGAHIDMNRAENSCQGFTQNIINDASVACMVTGSGGNFRGGGEFGNVVLEGGVWVFHGSSCEPGVFFNITCFRAIP
jgi:hypothetical protein